MVAFISCDLWRACGDSAVGMAPSGMDQNYAGMERIACLVLADFSACLSVCAGYVVLLDTPRHAPPAPVPAGSCSASPQPSADSVDRDELSPDRSGKWRDCGAACGVCGANSPKRIGRGIDNRDSNGGD